MWKANIRTINLTQKQRRATSINEISCSSSWGRAARVEKICVVTLETPFFLLSCSTRSWGATKQLRGWSRNYSLIKKYHSMLSHFLSSLFSFFFFSRYSIGKHRSTLCRTSVSHSLIIQIHQFIEYATWKSFIVVVLESARLAVLCLVSIISIVYHAEWKRVRGKGGDEKIRLHCVFQGDFMSLHDVEKCEHRWVWKAVI